MIEKGIQETMRYQGRTPTYILAALAGAGILAATVACGDVPAAVPAGPEYIGMCVDALGDRVPDSYCDVASSGFVLDYIDTYRYPSYVIPRIGSRLSYTNVTIIHNPPSGASVARTVPASGGSASSVRSTLSSTGSGRGTGGSGIQRGGFGVTGGSGRSGGGISAGS